ncbi:hypothetical protein [Paraflavitalea sp. CAU 1676]|uniref:hypothetical protein n=1 Tax=Paraflavitalea sp. CAU 1676 TaxID=3032598 RepID=UPI0023DA1238|nr:hypothetical protein [Paraflavitalea sp. CAU 1676]MDF2188874.1 hypothetical protein [Paraflavitalea sp. CAU 1676]
MRKMCLFAAFAVLAACSSNADKTTTEATKASDSTMARQEQPVYPFTADYSSNFEMGDPKNVQSLLELYKHWDNNTLDNAKSLFAASDTMYFSDGTMFAGSRDSLIAMAKQVRGQMGTVVDSVHAFMALRNKNNNDEWVCIWTREITTNAKGKTMAKELHETWRFDSEGKINLMYQYEQAPPKMPPPPPKK